MKPHVQHETDWDAPEARNLSLPNGGYREIRGTRLLWYAYEDVLHNGSWSHHDLVNMAKAEQIASGAC